MRCDRWWNLRLEVVERDCGQALAASGQGSYRDAGQRRRTSHGDQPHCLHNTSMTSFNFGWPRTWEECLPRLSLL